MDPRTRIGIVGTSWWTDSMYLPALQGLDRVDVVALCGRSEGPREALARAWDVPQTYADWEEMLEEADLDGVVVAAVNDVHRPITVAALERGVAVLCEKPLANNLGDAAAMAATAAASEVPTCVPFTYGFMPAFRWLERLVGEGYVGRVRTLRLQYTTGYGFAGEYQWRLDARRCPGGALGDIGSHIVHLAHRLAGPVDAVTARLETLGEHAPTDPAGEPYPLANDAGALLTEHAGGASGIVHFSTVAHEGTDFDQRHVIEVHGSDGTLLMLNDWAQVQQVRGSRRNEGPPQVLPIPDDIWGGVRRTPVVDTYKDVFRTTDAMTRGWALAIRDGGRVQPDMQEGFAVQEVVEAALLSSAEGRRVTLSEL